MGLLRIYFKHVSPAITLAVHAKTHQQYVFHALLLLTEYLATQVVHAALVTTITTMWYASHVLTSAMAAQVHPLLNALLVQYLLSEL